MVGELKLKEGRKLNPNENDGVIRFRFILPWFELEMSLVLARGVSGGT